MAVNPRELEFEAVFGQDSVGVTPEERARTSKLLFVRSQDHLGFANDKATGIRMTAQQALRAFGYESLLEVVKYGSAVLTASPNEPAQSIRLQRESLGLSHEDLAYALSMPVEVIRNAEDPRQRNSIWNLMKIAQALALDDETLGFTRGAGRDSDLALRLREIGEEPSRFDAQLVLQFSEAAWVISHQARLRAQLRVATQAPLPEPDSQYGDRLYPAWRHGYYLAQRTREILGLLPDAPIPSMRELLDNNLGIPVIQIRLPVHVAGATVSCNDQRGIAVNTEGHNRNAWVRRATLAHELGHLLWDPDQRLRRVAVDSYEEMESLYRSESGFEPVEARANAFAIEFLAPQVSVERVFRQRQSPSEGLRLVMETYGISYTAAKYQVWNALERGIPLETLQVSDVEPTDDWRGRESFGVDYFKPESVPPSRRGWFAFAVLRAQEAGLISEDSAAAWLHCGRDEYAKHRTFIAALYE